jgi:signal transduction histidine kinase
MAQRAVEKFNGALRSGQQIDYSHNGKSEINGDGGVINQILSNLLSNAIKYPPEHTRIEFETLTNDKTITIMVQDQGIGISADDQKHLFERFFRASNSGNIKGTGLGLHIVKRSIDLVGGTIEVESEIGKGTRFKISLPIFPDVMPM